MLLSEEGKVKISGEVNVICAELEHLLYFLKIKMGSKDYEKIINAVLKNVKENRIENLMNKEKDINKILDSINETLEEIIKTLK